MSETIAHVERESAEIWRRVAALIYDTFILVALSLAYGAIMLAFYSLFYTAPTEDYNPVLNSPAFSIGWYFTLSYFYYYFWRKDGQTLGMRAWRLRLLDWQGNIASSRSCIIRVLIAPVLNQLLFIGLFWKLVDKDKLCLQDRLSKTKVVVLAKQK